MAVCTAPSTKERLQNSCPPPDSIKTPVVMHKDKEENSHHDSHYRARELAALAAYDHHHLDGEMFLQTARALVFIAVKDTCFLFALDRSSQFANRRGEIYHRERDLVRDACLRNK
ncbi:hypothetical protein ALC60_04387 [Trachymyrmex zeteki]|uniref:Uncharacterized protein n=1 Tax=Mycetomoellerius zeteki TaxID=64791 RepID=A0A151X8T3_9HYME|nr:hypothetical protein ALC60_04387 [Trachymyrmex zeteki]